MTFDPTDIFECAHFDVTDDMIQKSYIVAYMFNQQVDNTEGETKVYSPKNFPDKAFDMFIPVSDDLLVEIFFDTKSLSWDSKFKLDGKTGKLSPDQMGQFFTSQSYKNILKAISSKWPLSDPKYAEMFNSMSSNRMKIAPEDGYSMGDELSEVDQANKRVDLANKDITGDGQRDYSGSGRKIVHFDDQGVKSGSAQMYCWPNPDPKMTFKWSQWKDWTKIKPFARMDFTYNGRKYMISLSLFDEMFDDRGFRGADLSWTPPLAWLTPGECDDIMGLSITRKFVALCIERIKKYLSMTPEQVYSRINNQDKITVKEIERTQHVIKHVLDSALRKHQADSYCWK